MAGLVPAIHVFLACCSVKTWMAGTSPGMTVEERRRPPHIRGMAKNPDTPKKPKTPKSKAPNKAPSRSAADRAGAGGTAQSRDQSRRERHGSGTGLQPPPDNSWDRRAGGEAAAHRARKSTPKNFRRVRRSLPDAAAAKPAAGGGVLRHFLPLPPCGEGRGWGPGATSVCGYPPPRPLPARGRGGKRRAPREPRPLRIPATRIRAGQLRHLGHHPDARSRTGETTRLHHRGGRRRRAGAAAAQQDGGARRRRHRGCAGGADPRRPPRIQGRGRPDKIWTPHRPPRPEKSEGGVRFVIKSEYEPKGDQPTAIKELVEGIAATTARRCCSASPARARPTPWPR